MELKGYILNRTTIKSTEWSYWYKCQYSKKRIAILLGVSALLMTACIHRDNSEATSNQLRSAAAERGYIDLQPGWTVQVVFPKLRSGGYVLPSMEQATSGNTIELRSETDFLGYEKDFYKVELVNGGMKVHFTHAELYDKGKPTGRSIPGVVLFPPTEDFRHIRLVYLVRESEADHDMAIISAADGGTLDQLTKGVIQDAKCGSGQRAVCKWVPRGIAVDWR